MKLSCICVAAVLVGGPAAVASTMPGAFAQTKAAAASDKTIEDRIEKRVARDASLKDFSIKVDVDHGVATLKGTVATEADRGKVAEIAKLSGATRVDNQLTADLDARTKAKGTTGQIEKKSGEAYDKTKEAGGKVAEYATDGWVTSRVKTKMIGVDELKDSDVHVSTDNHVVTLTGSVKSAMGRAKAVEIAKSI